MGSALSGARRQVLWNVRNALHDDATETPMTRWMIRAGAALSNRPARIVFNSRVSARQHEARGYRPEKTVVVPNGFDCAQFRPDAGAGRALRRSLGVPEDVLLVGMVARYPLVTGHVNLLDAAARLKAGGRPIHFVLAGGGADEGNRDLAALAADDSLKPRDISLLGERADVAEMTAACATAYTALRSEVFSNVGGE